MCLYKLLYRYRHSAPLNLSVLAVISHAVVVSWMSPATGVYCIDHYVIMLFNEAHNTMTSLNTTNKATSFSVHKLYRKRW